MSKNSNFNNKRVLFIRNGYYPDDPRLKKQVLALVEMGYKVDILCLMQKGQKLNETENNYLKIIRLPFHHTRKSSLLWYLFEYSLSILVFFTITSIRTIFIKYKFIVVHTLPDFLTFVAIVPKIFGSKIITDFHEPSPELLITKFNFSEENLIVRSVKFLEQAVISFSNINITVTEALKARFVERGANPNKIVVISNAVDTSTLIQFKDKIKITRNHKFQIITHGSIEKRYGHELVIKAISLLKDKFPQIKYVITGSGTYEKELKKLVSELELQNYVEFKGFLELDELVKTICSSDLGIIPMYRTPYSELIDTNKMYEYFELEIPVAMPKLKPLVDSFSHDEVIFFEPDDVKSISEMITKIILCKETLTIKVTNANLTYEKIKWEKEKLKFQKLFED